MKTIEIFNQMNASEFTGALNKIFEDMPKELSLLLEKAHDRYMHLAGITSGCFSEDTVSQDRDNFSHMVKVSERGLPIFCDNDCTEFMAIQYNLPPLLCRMFIANDYNWTISSGFIDDPNEMEENNETLKSFMNDNNEMAQVVTFLIERELLNTKSDGQIH